MQQESEAVNLERVLAVLRRRAPLIILCAVVVAGAAFAFSKHQPKKYTAQATLNFEPSTLYQQISGLPVSTPNNSAALLATQTSTIELVKSGTTAAETAAAIGHGVTEAQVTSSLSVSAAGETQIIFLTATTRSPRLSAKIANTYAGQFVKNQKRVNLAQYKAALAAVRRQIASLSGAQRVGPDGVSLQQRAQALSLLIELDVGSVRIASPAVPPTSPSSPKTSRNTAIGLIVGLIFGLLLTLVLERLDRKIRNPEDLEELYGLPLLGAVPKSSALARAEREGPDGGNHSRIPVAVAEGFGLIRARLRFFNIDRDLRVVMIASAEPGEGKSVISRRLAEAAARLGERVLLVEADLRHPTLAQRMGVPAGPGLAGVLIGATQPDQAIRTVQLPGNTTEDRSMDVLCAGSLLPPNPAELLEASAVEQFLLRQRSLYDLIVIDTPPLTVVSDAFPLLSKVDCVVVVASIGRSRRHSAQRLKGALARTGAPLLGLVVNHSSAELPEFDSYYHRRGSRSASAPAEPLASVPRVLSD